MHYPLSESQMEVIRLAEVVGDEVNTLSFSVLMNSTIEDVSALIAAARFVSQNHQLLHVVLDRRNHCMVVAEGQEVVQPLLPFSTFDTFEQWSAQLSRKAIRCEHCMCEIHPVLISETQSGYFVRAHHLVLDGWSAALLADELRSSYQQLIDGQEPGPVVDYPYTSFVEAEAAFFQSRRASRDAEFWKATLAGKGSGTIFSERSSGNFTARRFTFELSSDRLIHIAAQKNRTLQSILIAALATALSKMEDKPCYNLGLLLFNRLSAEEQAMIGNCFTTVPMPVDTLLADTFEKLVDQTADMLISLMRRQRTTYGRIVKQAFGEGHSAPLFDVLVNYMDITGIDLKYAEYTWYAPSIQLEALQLGFVVEKNSIKVHLDYREDRVSPQKIRELASRLTAVAEDITVRDWGTPIVLLEQAPLSQRKLMRVWNSTAHDYPRSETLFSMFRKNVRLHPEKTALICGDRQLTYRQFNSRVSQLADMLKAAEVRPGSIVALMLDRSFEMMTAIYAAICCGASYMPIAVGLPQDRFSFMLEDSAAPVVLTQSDFSFDCPEGVVRINLDQIVWQEGETESADLSRPDLSAYVIYTSGSTGMPKGVLIAHHSIVDRIHWMNRMFGMRDDDVVLQKTPYTFDVSVWELFWWSGYGGALAILPPEEHKDPQKIIDAVSLHRITKMHFVPSMLSAFLGYANTRNCTDAFCTLRQVFVSGEALMPAHVRKFYELGTNADLINLYGPTECTVDVSWFVCPRGELQSVPIGRPVDNTQLYVVDKHLVQLPIGAAGELCVGGNLVGIGYLNRPELTQERFVDNPYGSGKLYHTGDVAYWNDDGEIEYVGRMDYQVKLRGQRIELGEIEARMAEIPGVREAVAAVQKSVSGEQQLVAYYTGDPSLSQKAISDFLCAKLACYMIPQGYQYLPKLPMTVSGKADRKNLPFVHIKDAEEKYAAPQTPLEKELCYFFAKELQTAPSLYGREYDFFQHGGTSLSAIMLLVDLPERYKLQVADIYRNPTPRALAMFIENSIRDTEHDYSGEKEYFRIPVNEIKNPGIEAGKSILLTGSTGLLGVHLLHALLKAHPETEIICLVRSKQKLLAHWAYMFNEAYPANRIRALIGDIGKDRLGLSDSDYAYCVAHVASAYHSAADVRHFGVWETSYNINTLGTRRLIDLCLAANAVLHHVSTISVNGLVLTSIGERLSDTFTEENLFIGQRYRENVYVHSKYLAEKEIIHARKTGLKANIYRVGNLLWRASDGKFQKNREAHDFYMLSHAFLRLKAVPDVFAQIKIDLTAVDCAAEAIAALSGDVLGHTYHMMNPHCETLISYLKLLADAEYRIVSKDEMRAILKSRASDPMFGFMAAYLAANDKTEADTYAEDRCDATVAKLKRLGFEWTAPTREYVRYVLVKREGTY